MLFWIKKTQLVTWNKRISSLASRARPLLVFDSLFFFVIMTVNKVSLGFRLLVRENKHFEDYWTLLKIYVGNFLMVYE